MARFPLLSIFVVLALSFVAQSGTRSFTGVPRTPQSGPAPVDASAKPPVFFEDFEDERISPDLVPRGTLEFYPRSGALRIPVRTLKRNPKAGSLTCNRSVEVGANVAFALDLMLPGSNPDLTSSIYFCPPDAFFDDFGRPNSYIHFYKRSKVELIEVKDPYNDPRLLFARNNAVEGGAERRCVLELGARTFSVTLDGETLYSGKNPYPEMKRVQAGFWVATRGYSMSGGNVVVDNFTLEILPPKAEPPLMPRAPDIPEPAPEEPPPPEAGDPESPGIDSVPPPTP